MRLALAFLLSLLAGGPAWAGMNVSCGKGPTQPAIAAADGFNCLSYYEPYARLTGIDTANTYAHGFGNYLRNWYSLTVTPSANFTIINDALNISDTPTPGLAMESAAPVQSAAPISTFVGRTTYQFPFYWQFEVSVDQSLAPGSQKSDVCGAGGPVQARYNWGTLWLTDIANVIGQTNGTNLSSPKTEIDAIEFFVDCNGLGPGVWQPHMNIIYWGLANPYDFESGNSCLTTPTLPGTWNSVNFHTVGVEAKRMADNGGTGFVKIYVDDLVTPLVTCSWVNKSAYGIAEDANYMRIVNPGFNWAIKVRNEQWWSIK